MHPTTAIDAKEKRVMRTRSAGLALVLLLTLGPSSVALGTPFTSSGSLGAFTPTSSVFFDTSNGTFRVDGGAVQGGGVMSSDAGQSTMLYNFTSITLGPSASVTASGDLALGLLATSNIHPCGIRRRLLLGHRREGEW
jgi:hypothetical protein